MRGYFEIGPLRLKQCALAVIGVLFVGGMSAAVVKAPVKPRPKPKPSKLTILYTGDESGQIRSCNCSKFRFGGFSRQATAVDAIRSEAKDIVMVEGGDFLGNPESDQDKLKADASVKAIKLIGYNAVVPGEADLAFGAKALGAYQSASGVPFVAGNLKAPSGSALFSKPYTLVTTAGGLKVAVVGLVDTGVLPRNNSEFSGSDPAASLKKTLSKVRGGADFVVVVAHTTIKRGRPLAAVPGVDVVIIAHREAETVPMPEKDKMTVESPVEKVGNCLLVKSLSRMGWSLGRLDVTIKPGGVKYAKNSLIYLGRSFEESPAIVKVYEEYNTKVQDLVVRQQKQIKDQVLTRLAKRGIDPAQFKKPKLFVTSDSCKSCHEKAYDTWKASRHANAFASLVNRKQDFDPECISCHSTGAMYRGGFSDANSTPELINVQCESCHGSGAGHSAVPSKGYGAIGEETCRSCHTEEFNPDFEYEKMWKQIAH